MAHAEYLVSYIGVIALMMEGLAIAGCIIALTFVQANKGVMPKGLARVFQLMLFLVLGFALFYFLGGFLKITG